MFYIACTRFNNDTYKENMDYRLKYNETVIYGPSYKIRDIYPYGALIFVVEMNNEKNKIEGIGLIKNSLVEFTDNYNKINELIQGYNIDINGIESVLKINKLNGEKFTISTKMKKALTKNCEDISDINIKQLHKNKKIKAKKNKKI
jgi:GTPase involved in cell partitioning and DNA repair